ncbi:MAG TPA: sulfurtransferase [Candidatus Limnocylindrales bacterium]|nr:sulfurtransferase [Candidatus Limnocylindrales bacterium]
MSLISPEELAARIDEPDLRIVDVRWYLGKPGAGRAAYEAGHLPDAIHLDLDRDLVAPEGPGRHPLPEPSRLAARLGRAGIGDGDLVVAYDDVGGWIAARLWWMLDTLGHPRVSVLDGGLAAWTGLGLPTTTDEPEFEPAELHLAGHWSRVVDRGDLLGRLRSTRQPVLLDARAGPRYRGEVEPIDPVAGHIPTARSAPTDGNLGPDGRFLGADALRERFVALGADGGDVVTSCGSGVSACHHALAMRIAGLPDPILYPGSWSDWSTAGYPAATGPEPGSLPD